MLILAIEVSAAPPQGFIPLGARNKKNIIDPETGVVNSDDPEEADAADQGPRVKMHLNYIAAPWSKVLKDFAEATQTELVADRIPRQKFNRFDTKVYDRDDTLKILNQELAKQNFRLQFKGRFLVLNSLYEFRHEYPAAVLRGDYRNAEDSSEGDANDVNPEASENSNAPRKPVTHSSVHVKRPPQSTNLLRGKVVQASAEENAPSEGAVEAAPEVQEPTVTTVRLQARDAVTVSKVIFKAFKPQAELVDDGPRGLEGFLVRYPPSKGSRKESRNQNGPVGPRFTIGIDQKKNQLVVEASPQETRGVVKLIKTLDTVPPNPQATTRAIATNKDAGKLAAALQPGLDRLASATRVVSRQSSQRTRGGDDELERDDDQSAPAEERVMPQRGGAPRRDLRGETDDGARTGVPQALTKSIKGEVKVESVPDLGIMVVTGNENDVEAVMAVIQEIEKLSAGTAPEVRVAFLRHVSSEALATLLTSVYEQLGKVRNATVQQSQAITVFPVSRPNAILIVASKADMPAVYELVDELDQPSDPTSEFQVFRLKHAVPSQVVEKIEKMYPPQQQAPGAQGQGGTGLIPRVRIIDDLRTNSVIVQARPRDMREVALMIQKLDAADTASVSRLRIFPLSNAVADDLATTLNNAIQSVLGPPRAAGGSAPGNQQGQGGFQGGGGGGPQGGGSAELREVKSTILEFLRGEGVDEREIRSGILADIRITADLRTNSLVITAPVESMDLIEELVKRLDKPTAAVAAIKVFSLEKSDATAMRTLLEGLFGVQRQGQGGQGGQGQGQAPGMLLADAEDISSMLIPLRFSVDVRTNSVIAIGGAEALNVVEAVLLRLDESDIRQRKNEVYRLKNSFAPNVAAAVSQFLQTQRNAITTADPALVSPFEQIEREVIVVAEQGSNSLLISATPRYFEDIRKIILQLDKPPKQVFIQGLIVEVALQNLDEFGMEFGLQDSILFRRGALPAPTLLNTTTTAVTGLQTTTQQIISESATPGFAFSGQPLGNNTSPTVNQNSIGSQSFTTLGTGLVTNGQNYGGLVLQAGSENINFLLRALAQRTRVDILSRPQIRTMDNMFAQIQVGQEIPRISAFQSNATTGVASPLVQQRAIGIILQVTPRISPDGLVVMELLARKDDLDTKGVTLVTNSNGSTITSPIINTTNAQATIAVHTGQTVIFGGMITKNDTSIERKVPVLGDIPVLGNAFRYDFKQTSRTELLIFLTPRVITNDDDAEMLKQIEMERLNFIESDAERIHGPLFGMPPVPDQKGMVPDESPTIPDSQSIPSGKNSRGVPPAPEPNIPPSRLPATDDNEPPAVPAIDGDAGNGAAQIRNEDDEDLDAAFIQTNYQAPPKKGDTAGRARLVPSARKSAGESTATLKSKNLSAPGTVKQKRKRREEEEPKPGRHLLPAISE